MTSQRMGVRSDHPPITRRRFLLAGLTTVGAGLGASLLAACGQTATTPPAGPSPSLEPAAAPTSPPAPAPTSAAAAAATTGPATASTKKVSVRFNWTIKGEFAPFFVAQEKGFYREQGIEAELLEGKSGTQAAQVVGTGNDHFGFIPSIQVIQGVNQGIPIRTLATLGRNTGMCWASWPNVPLTGPKSLEGHKVSISTSSTFFQVWEAFARKFNVDKSKVEVIAADPSARVGLFLNRQVEIMADIFYANDYVILQTRTPDKLNLLKLADLDFDPVGYLLVANGQVLQQDKGLVKAFTQATLKGFQQTLDQPEEAIQIMTRLYGEQLGANVVAGQVKNLIELINTTPKLGANEQKAWDRSLDLLLDSGVIDKKLARDQYYTDEFVSA